MNLMCSAHFLAIGMESAFILSLPESESSGTNDGDRGTGCKFRRRQKTVLGIEETLKAN